MVDHVYIGVTFAAWIEVNLLNVILVTLKSLLVLFPVNTKDLDSCHILPTYW